MAGRKRGRRWVEWGKNVLIAALLCSAVFLAGQTNAYRTISTELGHRFSSLFHQGGASGSNSELSGRPLAASRPVAAAVCLENETGLARYGLQYSNDAVGRLFERHSGLLGEALAVAQTPQAVPQDVWQDALQSPGFYFRFPSPVPLSALYAWLGEGAENSSLTGSALSIVLCRGGVDGIELFYQSGEDGPYYLCLTALPFEEHMAGQLDGYSSNGALFAFELSDGAYDSLSPYVLLCDSPAPPVYQGSMPLNTASADALDDLQRQLSFHPQISTVYQVPDTISIREAEDSLRIGSTGLVSFHAEVRDDPRYPVGDGEHTPTATQLIDAAHRIVSATLSQQCGAATVSFTALTAQGGGYEVTFDYYLDGAAVSLPGGGHAARFAIREGQITDFWIRFRRYDATGETGLLLPEKQAAAALGALSSRAGTLERRYRDGLGDCLVTAAWALKE